MMGRRDGVLLNMNFYRSYVIAVALLVIRKNHVLR
jgi:hypothetical protein